jgi:hypothetical protein
MAKYLVSDNATTTLATGISLGATSVTVTAGTGALFPSPNPTTGTKFYGTFVSASNPNTKEVVTCTARSTDTMTISATTAAWSAGDTFMLSDTAELIEELVQFDDLQAQAGNYALDVGSANAYSVTLTPALTAHVAGMPLRWLAAHSNTGASTFNDGYASANLLRPNGGALQSGDIVANSIYTVEWNSSLSAFQLGAVQVSSFSQLSGSIANGQVPQSAVTQYTAAILASAALTGTPTAPTPTTGDNSTKVATTAFVETAATNAADAAANPGSSVGSSGGYQALLSGLIVQWGVITGAPWSSVPVDVNVTFPQTFPNACVVAFATSNRSVGSNGQAIDGSGYTSNYSATGMTVTIDYSSGRWIAIGY